MNSGGSQSVTDSNPGRGAATTVLLPVPPARGRSLRRRTLRWLSEVSFVAPSVVVLALVTLFPLLFVALRSLFNFNQSRPGNQGAWVGLENFVHLLGDARWWNSVWVTVQMMAFALPAQVILGLGLALLLQRRTKNSRLLVSLLLLPMTIAPITVGLAWRFMLNQDFGIIAQILGALGLRLEKPLLGNPATALPVLIVIAVWMWTPFMTLIMLSGLHSLPEEPLEAASMDGATPWQALRDVTIPLLRPVLLVAVLLRGIDMFQIFDEVYIMTGGGPGSTTEVMMIYGFQVNFRYFDTGYGSAIALVMGLIAFGAAALAYRMVKPEW